jgi:eukaryotic-like serine/threonine-protein kinase
LSARAAVHRESIRLATGVADTLAYAHRLGVIHRDIKPENILLQGGHALVADFGIALAVQQAGGQRMTQTGLSLGTPQYMSPKQATGEKTINARADVYALGAVTYEMLIGEPPFTAPTAQAIVARLLTTPPAPLIATRNTVPVHVEQAVLTALAKLPADRFATAAEFAAALVSASSIATAPQYAGAPNPVRRSRFRDPLVVGLGAIAIALAATAAALVTRGGNGGDDAFPVRSVITLDANGPIGPGVLSPDGHSVVHSGMAQSGNGRAYYLRRLDQLTAREIAGTEGSSRAPAFSPDGTWIAFIVGRRSLVKVPLERGGPVTLASVPDYGGITWSPSGQIVVGAGVDEGLQGLFRVSDRGGPLVPLTHIDSTRKELSHQQPRVLEDGKTILFTIWSGSVDRAEIAVTSLDDGKVVPLGILGAVPIGVIDGWLVYVGADGRVMAVPFDLRTRRTSGTPTLVQDGAAFRGGGGADHDEVSMSDAGGSYTFAGTRIAGSCGWSEMGNRRRSWRRHASSATFDCRLTVGRLRSRSRPAPSATSGRSTWPPERSRRSPRQERHGMRCGRRMAGAFSTHRLRVGAPVSGGNRRTVVARHSLPSFHVAIRGMPISRPTGAASCSMGSPPPISTSRVCRSTPRTRRAH